jgi:hypothetical protein
VITRAGVCRESPLRYDQVQQATNTIRAVEKPVHVHDFHATILHLLGLDHTSLTYRHAGRDFRLTYVYGEVVKEILA